MLTIAWDVDDVLNNFISDWYKMKWTVENPNSKIKFEELKDNPPHKSLGITKLDFLKSLDEFRVTEEFQNIPPKQEILDWFKKYGNLARHIALTAVPLAHAGLSANWVIKYFGSWIRSFNFVPSYREAHDIHYYDNSKGEFLDWFKNVDIFVEDNETNFNDAEAIGIKGFLVNKPWNSNDKNIMEVLEELTNFILDKK